MDLDTERETFIAGLVDTASTFPSEFLALFTEAIGFRGTLIRESDRGCALMAGAYLDTQLTRLLKQHFVDAQDVSDDLLSASKALGTFSARIDLTYLLGHLSQAERRDLHLIRKIRNEFGHVHTPISFEHPPIASRCRELAFSYHPNDYRPRGHFTAAAFGLLATIDVAIFQTKHLEARQVNAPTDDIKREVRESSPFINALRKRIEEQAANDSQEVQP